MTGMKKLAVLAVVAALAACGQMQSPHVLEGAAGEVILVASTRTGMEALNSGTLTIGPGGCLVVVPEQLDNALGAVPPIVWPPGTRPLDSDTGGVILPNGRELAVGDQVGLGGGNVDATSKDLPEIPSGCVPRDRKVYLASGD